MISTGDQPSPEAVIQQRDQFMELVLQAVSGTFEPARYAMGDTGRFAERVHLGAMAPRGDLSSTGYVLTNPGQEYLVLQPSAPAEPFTLTVAAGTYSAEWFNPESRETAEADTVTVASDGSIPFTPPFATGPAVLYLKCVGG